MPDTVIISAAVEGIVDDAVVRKLIAHAGGEPGIVYGKTGKHALQQKMNAYNYAARRVPWIVLVDLDRDDDCAPPLRDAWLAQPATYMCFRIAVREIESWLMADAQTLAPFLSVPRGRVPSRPETLENPKTGMVNLARRSRRRAIREDMVPRDGGGRRVGAAYSSRLIEYVETRWRPEVAAQHAESLRRTIACLRRLIEQASTGKSGAPPA
jgi:hypothetical protein